MSDDAQYEHVYTAEHEAHSHPQSHYVRIWAILLGLLCVSVIGPMFRHPLLTLVTAFGIAIVKAYMVAKNFMHIDMARRYVTYLVMTMLVFMLLFFAGTAPDVMKPEGTNWEKPSWMQANAAAEQPEAMPEHE
ncbi:MAG TPA: cytochrome C oxidase subunit IV family protein [Myxococcota bacterium]|jgi:caa(3)-type oxidase subunit IV|nr:cytochrome C oxidase subunit IV family protein [Myxococcota bacterium]